MQTKVNSKRRRNYMFKNLAYKGLVGATCVLAMTGLAGCGEVDNHSTYIFAVDAPAQITVNETVEVDVALKADEVRELGYEKVLIKVDVTDKENMTLKATDTQGQEWDVAQIGYWGPPEGFEVANDYDVTTTFKATAKKAGTYTITLNLVDMNSEQAVLTTKTITVKAVNA